MTQPAPGYQPYQPPQPMLYAPPPKPSGGGLTSMLAGILALVVAGVVVGGSFAPITTFRNAFEGDGDPTVYGTESGWWGYTDAGSTEAFEGETSLFGLALVLVAALLVLGAVFAFVASRTRTPGPTSGGRSLISAGTGVLTGVLLLQTMSVLEEASGYNERELEAGESVDFSAGLGLILPLSGLGLALIAVVLAHVGQRPRAVRVEPNTPRMGFPAPYGYQQVQATAATQPPPVAVPVQSPAEAASSSVSSDDDDSETTQVVSGATASGEVAVADAPSGEAEPTPAAPTPPAPVAPPAPAASPAPVTPATTTPAAEVPTPAEPPVATPDAEPHTPTPLTDLPAAPPAPELPDGAKQDDK